MGTYPVRQTLEHLHPRRGRDERDDNEEDVRGEEEHRHARPRLERRIPCPCPSRPRVGRMQEEQAARHDDASEGNRVCCH